MSQHDYNIANGGGAAVRSDLNLAFAAILSQNSGATAPTTTKPFMFWYDTTTGVLKMRNAADTAWVAAIDGITGGNSQGLKNRIINGAMVIDQRNAGASVTPNNSYTLDRWATSNSQTSKFTIQQNAGAITPPAGFVNYLGITSSSAYSVLTGDYFAVYQAVEGFNAADFAWGTASAATVTLSFLVRSSLTGTFGGSVRNSAGNRSYPFTFSVSSANTWETKSVTIAGDTSGVWATNNTSGMSISFAFGAGTTFSGTAGAWAAGNFLSATGTTSVVGTSGATFYITGVQLEKGSTATAFDYRPYGTELALCQRYLPALISSGTVEFIGNAQGSGTTNIYPIIQHPVTPRVAPTGLSVSAANIITVNGFNVSSAIAFANGGLYASRINVTTTGLTNNVFYGVFLNTTGATLLFTGCEL